MLAVGDSSRRRDKYIKSWTYLGKFPNLILIFIELSIHTTQMTEFFAGKICVMQRFAKSLKMTEVINNLFWNAISRF